MSSNVDLPGKEQSDNQIHELDWLVKNGFEAYECTAVMAARSGHIEVLAWAKTHVGIAWTTDVCSGAAHYGLFDALKWLRQLGTEKQLSLLDYTGTWILFNRQEKMTPGTFIRYQECCNIFKAPVLHA